MASAYRRLVRSTALCLGATVALTLALTSGLAVRAQPGEPSARINQFYAALLDTMKGAKRLGLKGRYDKLLPIVTKTFDVAGMMRIAAGPAWEGASPAQQATLVDAFSRMMTATYASRFDDFTGESFEVSPALDQPPGNKLVRTRLIQANGKTVMLNYLMRQVADGWRIGDVYLDGTVSELAARRAEFTSIIRSGGPDALANSLQQKAEKLLSGS